MNICFEISSRLYKRKLKSRKKAAEMVSHLDYWQWQYDSSKQLFKAYPGLDLANKNVLEIGCGIGGRTCYLASLGVKSMTGIDINHEEIQTALELKERLSTEDKQKVSFIATTESAEELAGQQFDVVLLIDSLEHVIDPQKFLELAYRLTKPGGVAYFSNIGWFHYKGSHMNEVLFFPFVNVFFSDKQILDAIRLLVTQDYYVPTIYDSVPPLARYEGITDLRDRPGEYLNKITIKQTKALIKNSPFNEGKLHVHGFSDRIPVFKYINFLAQIPIIQEMYHSYYVGKLLKY